MAIKAQAPILPVAVTGGRDAMRRGSAHRATGDDVGADRRPGAHRRADARRPRSADRRGPGPASRRWSRRARSATRRGGVATMELLATAGRTLGFSLAAGVNLYATVAMLGLAARFDLVDLPPQFSRLRQHLDHRRRAGALRRRVRRRQGAVGRHAVGHRAHAGAAAGRGAGRRRHPGRGVAVAAGRSSRIAGGTLAAGGHLTKAGTRAAVNVSPEPFSNWAFSLAEDVFVIGLGLLALNYPAGRAGRHGALRADHRAAGPQADTLAQTRPLAPGPP